MWAFYDYSLTPLIKVNFIGRIKKRENFLNFVEEWRELYRQKKDFNFIFDTRNVGLISPVYCYMMANFIHELKNNDYQYLKYSVIIVKNKVIQYLLNIIFKIQKPVAPIYMIEDSSENKKIVSYIVNISNKTSLDTLIVLNKNKFNIIRP